MSSMIRVGSAVRISWPSDSTLDGKVGVVLEQSGRMLTEARGEELLYRVDVEGFDRVQVLGGTHLGLLAPELEQYVHSTRFALTGSDVVYDSLNGHRYGDYDGDISTCQSCGHYADAMVHKSCPSCGGYLG